MVTLELDRKGVRLESCTELQDLTHILEYRNHFTLKKDEKVLYKEVDLKLPYRDGQSDMAIMVVKMGDSRYKEIIGQYGNLLALFVLVSQFQNGTIHCRYCKRVFPNQCVMTGFLNLLAELK